MNVRLTHGESSPLPNSRLLRTDEQLHHVNLPLPAFALETNVCVSPSRLASCTCVRPAFSRACFKVLRKTARRTEGWTYRDRHGVAAGRNHVAERCGIAICATSSRSMRTSAVAEGAQQYSAFIELFLGACHANSLPSS
jgi:hypothetical protein